MILSCVGNLMWYPHGKDAQPAVPAGPDRRMRSITSHSSGCTCRRRWTLHPECTQLRSIFARAGGRSPLSTRDLMTFARNNLVARRVEPVQKNARSYSSLQSSQRTRARPQSRSRHSRNMFTTSGMMGSQEAVPGLFCSSWNSRDASKCVEMHCHS